MNTYTWDCNTVDVYPTHESLTDVVYNVHWRLTGKDATDTYSATVIGTEMLSIETIQPEGFIPVADLTNAQVTSWVEEQMGADRVAELKASVDSQIASLITPTTITMQIGPEE
jgi:hypothetical protein